MATISLNEDVFRDKVLACWMGKNIGGTLGAPFEWKRQINNVSFYTQDLRGEPVPNDDLDLQLLWLVALEQQGLKIDSRVLSEYWSLFLTPHWMEYGISKANLRAGLVPPLSGTYANPYRHSCGAFIRSEIWACIAPGLPDVAARYAYEDASIDHGSGEGMWAEVFFAALESAAFLVSGLRELIAIGLSHIPADCAIRQAIDLAVAGYDQGQPWPETRDALLRAYRGGIYYYAGQPSAEDVAKGLGDGITGFDAPVNVALTILGLLHGGEDFGKVICTAVNCGEDTDCTAATAASIFGLMHGTEGIPARWLEPIGRSIKTCCLNLGDLAPGLIAPTVDDLTDRTINQARQLLLQAPHQSRVALTAGPSSVPSDEQRAALRWPAGRPFVENPDATVHRFDFFSVLVDVGPEPLIRNGEARALRLIIRNHYGIPVHLALKWHLPAGWGATPAAQGTAYVPAWSEKALSFQLHAGQATESNHRAVLELTAPGRATVMLVPVVLLSGNLAET